MRLFFIFSAFLCNFIIANSAPIVESNQFKTPENRIFIGTIQASDPEGDELLFYLQDSSEITVNEINGELNFVESPDYETKNEFYIKLLVSDGISTTSKDVTIFVRDKNESPVLNSKSFTAFSGEDTRMRISAFDPEGEELSYALSEKDSYLFRVSKRGIITFDDEPEINNDTTYRFKISISDGVKIKKSNATVSLVKRAISNHASKIIFERTLDENGNSPDIYFRPSHISDDGETLLAWNADLLRDRGAVHIYTLNDSNWEHAQTIRGNDFECMGGLVQGGHAVTTTELRDMSPNGSLILVGGFLDGPSWYDCDDGSSVLSKNSMKFIRPYKRLPGTDTWVQYGDQIEIEARYQLQAKFIGDEEKLLLISGKVDADSYPVFYIDSYEYKSGKGWKRYNRKKIKPYIPSFYNSDWVSVQVSDDGTVFSVIYANWSESSYGSRPIEVFRFSNDRWKKERIRFDGKNDKSIKFGEFGNSNSISLVTYEMPFYNGCNNYSSNIRRHEIYDFDNTKNIWKRTKTILSPLKFYPWTSPNCADRYLYYNNQSRANDTLIFGGPRIDNQTYSNGKAYIYFYEDGEWNKQKFKSPASISGRYYGEKPAISKNGEFIAIGNHDWSAPAIGGVIETYKKN